MRFVFAPDSFKGSLTALEIVHMLSDVAKKHFPEAEFNRVPVADGGEGTVDALVVACGGEILTHTVTGPTRKPISAKYGLLPDGTAVIEMAQTSGLPAMEGRLDPMKATSAGLGELIAHMLNNQRTRLLVGIGGSATNDCGMGMLHALGARFYGAQNQQLLGNGEDMAQVARVDLSGMHPLIKKTEIHVICDVTNPLLGPSGATAIYGPQKGVTKAQHAILEAGMAHFACLLERAIGKDISNFPGSGAAGGVGAALGGVLGAKLESGIDAVLDIVGFDDMLPACDLVITGEGRLDGQSISFGKVPAGICKRCAKQNVPVIAIVGCMGDGADAFFDTGINSIMTTINAPMDIGMAMNDAKTLFIGAADRMFRMLRIGYGLERTQA